MLLSAACLTLILAGCATQTAPARSMAGYYTWLYIVVRETGVDGDRFVVRRSLVSTGSMQKEMNDLYGPMTERKKKAERIKAYLAGEGSTLDDATKTAKQHEADNLISINNNDLRQIEQATDKAESLNAMQSQENDALHRMGY